MNKTLPIILRIISLVYGIALALYLAFLIYNLEFKPVVAPASTIPSLSVSGIANVTEKLKVRLSISPAIQYGTSSGTLYGRTEPFQ